MSKNPKCVMVCNGQQIEGVEVLLYDETVNRVQFKLPRTETVVTAKLAARVHTGDDKNNTRQWQSFEVCDMWTPHDEELVSVYSDDDKQTFTVTANGGFLTYRSWRTAQQVYETMASTTLLNAEKGDSQQGSLELVSFRGKYYATYEDAACGELGDDASDAEVKTLSDAMRRKAEGGAE